MANRPPSRASRSSKSSKRVMTQAEINRVRPDAVLSYAVIEKAASVISSVNVKFPDGQIYKFFHLPMSIDDGQQLFKLATEESRLAALRQLLSDLVVTEDGKPFATYEQWGIVPVPILNKLHEAMTASAKDEPGED